MQKHGENDNTFFSYNEKKFIHLKIISGKTILSGNNMTSHHRGNEECHVHKQCYVNWSVNQALIASNLALCAIFD